MSGPTGSGGGADLPGVVKLPIHTIGDGALQGAILNQFGFECEDEIKGKIFVFRYAEVTCDADSLVSQVAWLFKNGAYDVQLISQPK